MSYTPKQQGSGGSGNQQSQQAKSFAGITQQMQNLVHGQNSLPQTSQTGLGAMNFANLNITLQQQQQQQRFESIIKQQQFLLSTNPQIQQHFQQQIQQQQNAAKDLLNKSLQQHQQQANGSTASASLASNLANQQLHQQLQAFAQNPANIMQHLQAYQYQIQQQQQQQQQHQQKMIPLNQTQQSLASGQLDVNVAQQHMQQIQQTIQQQQKLLASHTKNITPNQLKVPVTSSTSSSSVPVTNTSIQIQSNNNLPNKNTAKGTISSVTQVKQTNSPGPVKTPPIQGNKIHGVSSSASKTGLVPQTTVKSSPLVIYSPKVQSTPVSLTRTTPSTVSSSTTSRLPATIQQIPKAITSPSLQTSIKTQNLQSNNGKSITNTDVSLKIKSTMSGSGKNESVRPNPSNSTTETTITIIESKKQEDSKQVKEIENDKEKEKVSETEQKEKKLQDSSDQNEKIEKKSVNAETKEIKETKEISDQKQDQMKNKESISKQNDGSTQILESNASDLGNSMENNTKNDNLNKLTDDQIDNASEKLKQKVPPSKVKSNPRRNTIKNEKEKTELEKSKEKLEKEDEKQIEKVKDQEGEKEKLNKEKFDKKIEEKEKCDDKDEKLNKEKSSEKDKSNKEKFTNIPQNIKNDRKRNTVSTRGTNVEKVSAKTGNKQLQSSTPTNDERRSKRHRLKTILYQSPLPELAYITKLSVSESSSNSPRNNDEKLTLFFKLEYLAVRNAEGGFFICQTLQNIYKSSKRIRIRWFSEEKKDNSIFNPDFYDNTDLECILTTVEMEKLEKDRFKLPKSERTRIENILKKAMDVEKGITPRPDITEENPDGLDISLLKTESQITRTPRRKRAISKSPKRNRIKSPKKKKSRRNFNNDVSSQEEEYDNDTDKEYKPRSNKKNVLDGSEPKLRAQRSPLTKAQNVSPSTSTKKDDFQKTNKSVPPKPSNTVKKEGTNSEETSTQISNKNERPKRKVVESVISYDEELVAAKRLAVAKQIKRDEISTKLNEKSENNSSLITEENQTKNKTESTVTQTKTSTTTKTTTGTSFKRKKLTSSPTSSSSSSVTNNSLKPSAGNEKDLESVTSAVSTPNTSVTTIANASPTGAGNRLTRNRK